MSAAFDGNLVRVRQTLQQHANYLNVGATAFVRVPCVGRGIGVSRTP